MGAARDVAYNRPAMRRPLPLLAATLLTVSALPPFLLATAVQADDAQAPVSGEGTAPATKPAAKPPLDLDTLLKPPAVKVQPTSNTYGGRDQRAWQEEFRKARQEVSDLEGKVEAGQAHLRSAASGEWNYSPAGGEPTDPEVLRLRSELRRNRQSLEASRQRLRDLQVEASLAGVPEAWRTP
jgi:hypothetical protein